MQGFISTETIVLLSLLGKKMPNLVKYILEYSTPKTAKSAIAINRSKMLSAKQIQEAARHPSDIIESTLRAISAVQTALSATNAKIEELTKQRAAIEKTLITLLSINEKAPE